MSQGSSSSSTSSTDQRKIALIVGQNNYETLDKLYLSIEDAKLIDKTLQKLDFETIVRTNLTHDELDSEFMKLSKILKPNDIVFFYYSGHATQQTFSDHKPDNFLFGIDATTQEREGGKYVTRGIPLQDRIIYKWLNEKCVFLIVLDACRKYPSENHQFRFKDGSSSSQVPERDESKMTLIAPGLPENLQCCEYDFVFACQPGKGAIENTQRSSGYLSAALSDALSKKSTWSEAVIEAMRLVKKESKYQQQPSLTLNVSQELYLAPKILKKSESSNLDVTEGSDLQNSSEPESEIHEEETLSNLQNNQELIPQKYLQPNLNNTHIENLDFNPDVNAVSDLLNNLEPDSEIFYEILSTLQDTQESMPQTIQEPDLNETLLQKSTIDQLQNSIKQGSLRNLHVEFKKRSFNINAYPLVIYGPNPKTSNLREFQCKKFSSTILIQGLKLVSATPKGCKYLQICVEWGYNIKIQNCIFDGIGLEIYFRDQKRQKNCSSPNKIYYRPNIILNQVKICNTPNFGIKLQKFNSIYMNEVVTENCGQYGFYLNNIKDLKIQKANVSNSNSGIYVNNSKKICIQNVDIKNCLENAFEFRNSQGSVIDCRYQNCFNGIRKNNRCMIGSESLREV